MDNTSAATWHKIAVISTIMVFTLPFAGKWFWQVVFPADKLLYEVVGPYSSRDIQVGSIAVKNLGSNTQENVVLYLPSEFDRFYDVLVGVSSPKAIFLSSFSTRQPEKSLKEFQTGGSYELSLGKIGPDEQVTITFASHNSSKDIYFQTLAFSDVRVESDTLIASDASRRVPFSAHSAYFELAPYLLAIILVVICIVMLVGALHDMFFDSTESKITRLWKQLDDLIEKKEKEDRYK